jgi:hypothetical protein
VLGRQPQHPRPARADHDRRPLPARPARAQLALARLVIAAREVDLPLPQQGADDGEGLLEAAGAVVERVAEGAILPLVPARADAEDEPPAADLVDRVGHLRQSAGLRKLVERT